MEITIWFYSFCILSIIYYIFSIFLKKFVLNKLSASDTGRGAFILSLIFTLLGMILLFFFLDFTRSDTLFSGLGWIFLLDLCSVLLSILIFGLIIAYDAFEEKIGDKTGGIICFILTILIIIAGIVLIILGFYAIINLYYQILGLILIIIGIIIIIQVIRSTT